MRSLFHALSNFIRRLLRLPARSSDLSERDLSERDLSERDRPRNPPHFQPHFQSDLQPNPNYGQAVDARVSASLRRLVYQATYELPQKKRTHAAQVGALFRQKDRSFSYEKYNFTKLIDLLEAVPDLVQMERIEPDPSKPGAAPVYYVRPATDTRKLLTTTLASYDSADGWVHLDSLYEAITHQNPSFSAQRYGFSDFKTFIQSRSDLVEFNADSPSYVRLNPSREQRLIARPKRIVPRRPATVNNSNPILSQSIELKIESLSKSVGFSMEMLNQKVNELAAIALPENWYFGPQPPADFAYPILKSYLRCTFIRLQHESKVLTSDNTQYKAFNTGLLDMLLRPIYALLTRPASDLPNRQWNLVFCIAGEGFAGKKLVAQFPRLPAAANYFEQADQAFYYLAAGAPQVDWQHVVKDNMARFPLAFLEQYAPAGFTPQSTQGLTTPEFFDYKRAFVTALEADPAGYRTIVNKLEEALDRTLKRTQINYKTAVPTYYPKLNSIDLLLPLCLVDESTVDLALVVRREPSGKYIGHTVLTMRQAYNNARLICKLDEHWLTRSLALSQAFDEDEEEDEETAEETAYDSEIVKTGGSRIEPLRIDV